jgi:hypothetical protein
MRTLVSLALLLVPAAPALADDQCMQQCGVAFNYCIMHVGSANDWGLEICGDALGQCEKRCQASPVTEVVASELNFDLSAIEKKK